VGLFIIIASPYPIHPPSLLLPSSAPKNQKKGTEPPELCPKPPIQPSLKGESENSN